MTSNLSEFSLINHYIASLADHPSAGGLKDDVARIAYTRDQSYIISQDAMVEGRHFLRWFKPFDIAYKLMAANVSDIIAKGGTPQYYLLSLMLPEYHRNDIWLKNFFDGMHQSINQYGGYLIGGDTTAAEKLHLSLTIIGINQKSVNTHRENAKTDDDIWVTGTIGDGELALNYLDVFEKNELLSPELQHLKNSLMRPSIPFGVQDIIASFANASCDISDGLLSDVAHIARASNKTAIINFENIPRSDAFLSLCSDDFIGGGDDYQSLWTASKHNRKHILSHAKRLNINISRIGTMVDQKQNTPVKLIKNQEDITPRVLGYTHF